MKLYLLKGCFVDDKIEQEGKFFCTECALIEGLLAYFPDLNEKLDIQYIDFKKPRKELVDLLGIEHQSCPVLVLDDGKFINDVNAIISYLHTQYDIARPHP